jgi:hypothetical protein
MLMAALPEKSGFGIAPPQNCLGFAVQSTAQLEFGI